MNPHMVAAILTISICDEAGIGTFRNLESLHGTCLFLLEKPPLILRAPFAFPFFSSCSTSQAVQVGIEHLETSTLDMEGSVATTCSSISAPVFCC